MDHEQKRVLNKICQVSPVSIEIFDVHNDELVCTNGWTSYCLGYTQEEYQKLSKNLFETIVHPDDRSIQLSAHRFLQENPEAEFKEFTLRVLRKDGTYGSIQIRLTLLEQCENKSPETVLASIVDVTEVVALRCKLDDQLRKMDVISFKNSHDLRGPVATILGLIQLIEHDQFDGSQSRDIIGCLKKTIMKLDDVIHEINEHTY